MNELPITPEQAQQVDEVLKRQEVYLAKLAKRLDKMLAPNHPLRSWSDKADWYVSGLRVHFAQWAAGKSQIYLGPPPISYGETVKGEGG
jgi:hypothetical protein